MTSFLESTQRLTDTSGQLALLELSAPSFNSVLRIANDNQDWTSNGNVYVGYPFRFTLPTDQTGQTPRSQLELDNVGRGITEDLERLQPNELVRCVLMIVYKARPDTIIRRFTLPLTQVSASGTVATAQAGVDFLMRQQAVKLRATPYTLPGVF